MQHKKTIQVSNDESKKQLDNHQSELELKSLDIARLQRQLSDKDEELVSVQAKAKTKYEKLGARLDSSTKKLNEIIQEQL